MGKEGNFSACVKTSGYCRFGENGMDSWRCPRFQWIRLYKWSCCSFRHGSATWNSRIRSCNKKLEFLSFLWPGCYFIYTWHLCKNKHQHIAKKNKQNQLTIKLVFWIGGYGVGNPRPSFFLVRKNYTKTFSVPKSAPSEVNPPGGPTCNITGRNSSPLSTCKGAAAMVTSAEKTCRQADKGRTPFHWKNKKNRDHKVWDQPKSCQADCFVHWSWILGWWFNDPGSRDAGNSQLLCGFK